MNLLSFIEELLKTGRWLFKRKSPFQRSVFLTLCTYLIFRVAGEPLTTFSNLLLDSLPCYVGL